MWAGRVEPCLCFVMASDSAVNSSNRLAVDQFSEMGVRSFPEKPLFQ